MRLVPRAVLMAAVLVVVGWSGIAFAEPDAFSFIERSNVPAASFVTSEAKTLSGISSPLTVNVSGGNSPQYRIDNGAFTAEPASIANGQTLTVRHISADAGGAQTLTSVGVGSYSTPFISITGEADRVPDVFGFGGQGNVAPGALIESATIILTGFNTGTAIVAGPGAEYRINNGTWGNASGTLLPGQSLTVRHTSSTRRLEYTKTTLKVGGVTGYFTTRTQGALTQAAYPQGSEYTLSVRPTSLGTVTSNPAGIDCGAACSKVFSASSTVTLSALAVADYRFAAWSGDCHGAGACTVPLNGNKSVGALFVPLNPDALPRLSIYPAEPIRESEAAAATAQRFELRLTRTFTKPVTVHVRSRDGSAKSGSDYTAFEGDLTIPAGERRAFAAVGIKDDSVTEPDKSYELELTEARNAVIETSVARGLILDDDLAPGCNPLPASGLCAGAAEGALRVPVGAPLGGYLRPPVGGEYFPTAGNGDIVGLLNALLSFIPSTSEGGAPNVVPPNEARKSPYSTYAPSSRGYYETLLTKAVALSNGGKTIVFVKNDVVGMIDELGIDVGAQVKTRTGIDLGNGLIMSATHTHDGPGGLGNTSLKYFWIALDAYHQDLYDQLVKSISDVVIAALNNRVPARIGYATGLEDQGLNSFRRTRAPSYTAARIAEQDLMRRRLSVFRVDQIDASGAAVRPLAAMVNYSAHGIMFDVENLYFSEDCLGGLERSVEARFDTPMVTMLIQNTTGDVSPRADGGPTRQRIERFGELIAPQIMKLWNGVNNFNAAPTLRVLDQRIILSLDRLGYTNNEYPYPYGAVQCNNKVSPPLIGGPSAGSAPVCVAAPPPGAEDLADNGVGENDAFVPQDTRIAVAQVGDAILLMQPGEPLAEQGLRLLEASSAPPLNFPREKTFIWGYSLDHVGYILPNQKDDWDLGGTEGTTTFWGWKQGGRFVNATKDLLTALKNNAPEPPDEFALNYTHNIPSTPPPASVSPQPGVVMTQPASIKRFQTAKLLFEGGDPIIDLPAVTLEEDVSGVWLPMRRNNGRVLRNFYEFWVDYALTNGAHGWTIRFEPAKDFPVGRYRFSVKGQALLGPGPSPYAFATTPFTVSEADNLQLTTLKRTGDTVEVTLAYTAVPNNYRLIDPVGSTASAAPVRLGRVRFTSGANAVEVLAPVDAQAGTAVYRATLVDGGTLKAEGQDIWGNRGATP